MRIINNFDRWVVTRDHPFMWCVRPPVESPVPGLGWAFGTHVEAQAYGDRKARQVAAP